MLKKDAAIVLLGMDYAVKENFNIRKMQISLRQVIAVLFKPNRY